MTQFRTLLAFAILLGSTFAAAIGAPPDFQGQELPTRLSVGYAVRLIDMNDDQRLDIAIVDKTRILWLENPTWREHVLVEDPSKTDNVSFAPNDINGDGKLDFAVGADWTVNTREGGTIQWITGGANLEGPWALHPIGQEPTVHRMRFANLVGDDREELIVLPLMGRNSSRPNYAEAGVRILMYEIPADPVNGPWTPTVINDDLHVTHNLWPIDFDNSGSTDLLVVSFEGVSLLEREGDGWKRTLIGSGNQETSPNKGASEIKVGSLAGGAKYIATIEPWHGSQVVVYTRPEGAPLRSMWQRQVLDESLQWGHAVWCANVDDDPEEELIIGVRDNKSAEEQRGVRIYDPPSQAGGEWERTLIDPNGVAVEDLAAGDIDGDGRVDIVAVGRATGNVKIYWNRPSEAP